jgi:hypothetical protein
MPLKDWLIVLREMPRLCASTLKSANQAEKPLPVLPHFAAIAGVMLPAVSVSSTMANAVIRLGKRALEIMADLLAVK